jgi:ferredoxin
MDKVALAYFSGTGCTKTVCDCFFEQFMKHGIDCDKININAGSKSFSRSADLLIILSPVYAFRMVSTVHKWIKGLPHAEDKNAAIISVSAGGEVIPNSACRVRSKRLLKEKGYNIIYEEMIIMPLNVFVKSDRDLDLSLLAILPYKVKRITKDILSGRQKLENPGMFSRLFAAVGVIEHLGAMIFGKGFHASSACDECGVCARDCPQGNIRMKDGGPDFGFHCVMCLKCIYNCPRKALSPRFGKSFVFKDGFDIDEMVRAAKGVDYKKKGGVLWKGVIDYLSKDIDIG